MPELPEVETIARGLRQTLVGQQVADVAVRWERIVASPSVDEFRTRLLGQTILSVGRRGKYLVFGLSADTLIIHLRMTGQLLCAGWHTSAPAVACDDPHAHLMLRFTSGAALCYRDVRKFGRFWLVADPAEVLGTLGPEPLDPGLTAARFHALVHARRRRLKDLLLDQAFLAGLGNIYVDEALWQARLHPRRRGSTLAEEESARLHDAMRAVLRRAIAARGTTLRDYRDAFNAPGSNQDGLAVYGRAGQPCPRCGAAITREVVAGRGTHVCPVCQGE
ncbi:MAG: bifunctional DNA-formamidopyrimidine glycosylase/DNA-(apurinic or apyrimidinic site) lyase [Chloroflexi bacterium]|nr:bifunctional DNA-formamidopyrimidine glycosylase/DNA-(apurinic or apyrimidinic site) lyase [Chloroflexota bacterium]